MPSPKKAEIPLSMFAGVEATKVELSKPESDEEKSLRLHKEKYSFYRDIGALLFAAALVAVTAGFCLMTLWSAGASASEKQWAQGILTGIVTGAVGYAFGKNSK